MESIYMKHLMESTYRAWDGVSTQSVSVSSTKVIVVAQITKHTHTHTHTRTEKQIPKHRSLPCTRHMRPCALNLLSLRLDQTTATTANSQKYCLSNLLLCLGFPWPMDSDTQMQIVLKLCPKCLLALGGLRASPVSHLAPTVILAVSLSLQTWGSQA